MTNSGSTLFGAAEELWRYPVKSMLGEQLDASEVTENGLLGDRETCPTARSRPPRVRANGRTCSITRDANVTNRAARNMPPVATECHPSKRIVFLGPEKDGHSSNDASPVLRSLHIS
jgi:hypothetical protein